MLLQVPGVWAPDDAADTRLQPPRGHLFTPVHLTL